MDTVDILLVEDNPGDVALIERAFDDRELPGAVHAVRTGDEALNWLHRRDEFAEAPRPDLVFLDLNLPATSGHAVLDEIRSDPRLQRLPVIILTSSQSEEDLVDAYEACANACLIKPVDPEEYTDLIDAVVEFWASTVALPPPFDSGE